MDAADRLHQRDDEDGEEDDEGDDEEDDEDEYDFDGGVDAVDEASGSVGPSETGDRLSRVRRSCWPPPTTRQQQDQAASGGPGARGPIWTSLFQVQPTSGKAGTGRPLPSPPPRPTPATDATRVPLPRQTLQARASGSSRVDRPSGPTGPTQRHPVGRSFPLNGPLVASGASGNPVYGHRMKLYCRSGFHLSVGPKGRVVGTDNPNDKYAVLEFSSVTTGEVRIRGVEADLFLAMNRQGKLYGQANIRQEGTVFAEMMLGQYNTYLSRKFAHLGWYVAIKKNGKQKPGMKTAWGQKAIQFLPIRI